MRLVQCAAAAFFLAAPAVATAANDAANTPGMGAHHSSENAAMTTADGAGIVTAVDAKAGTVTIHHGPIAKLNWPAMTMAFKATPSSLLQSVKVGQSVKFQLMQMGGETTLTSIQPK